jgi:hypothetical protein
MTDRHLFDLAPGWALGADSNQWMLLRVRKRRDETYHQAISFIGSTKTVLLRVLREKGVQPAPEAHALLQALPEKFRDFNREGTQKTDISTKSTIHQKGNPSCEMT